MAGESGSFWQLERVNRRRTRALVAKLILALAAFGLGLDFLFHTVRFGDGRISGFPWFATAAVVLAVAQSLRAYFAGADLVLGALGAHPFFTNDQKNQVVIDVVHEMALAARIPEPRIDLIDDPSPNAFAIGRDSEHSKICVTQGLLDQMDREELQGVIGHEMAHIRNCDIRLTTMVTAMFGGFGALSGRLVSIMLSREREFLADASAVEFTRNPTALIRALEHIAKTESPLRSATPGTAQLFIVDPFERADGGRSYKEFIDEVTRLRMQPGKTEEQRDEEARNFAAHEYPRNLIVEAVSSHPPLRERIARLQALIGARPGAAPASDLIDEQLRAKFSESAMFVRNAASTDPEVLAKVMQSALLALPAGRRLLQETIGGIQIRPESASGDPIEQKLYESNLASTGDLKRDPITQKLYEANLASTGDMPPPRTPAQKLFESVLKSTDDPESEEGADSSLSPASAAQEEQQVETLAKMLGPVAASMRRGMPAPHPSAAERPSRSGGSYLFWIVIAISAGAIVAAFATK